ncbi:hypothetical protein [Streptomyces sp. NPDC060131]|uniref:hypothetical protein n=1 Tax=unclassified Streptomyces TaxID=2593676 RepID=UPI003647A447
MADLAVRFVQAAWPLDVSLRRVEWDSGEGSEVAVRAGGRREVLREMLAVVAREGGTALVCCTTVAEARSTRQKPSAKSKETTA